MRQSYELQLGKDAGKKTREARTRGSSAAPVKRTAARKTGEAAGKKPSAGQVKEAVEKLDREIQEINREYHEAGLEAQYSDSGVERARELEEAGERRERKLAGACENSTHPPFWTRKNAIWGTSSGNCVPKVSPWRA